MTIRPGTSSDQYLLEELQRRASLAGEMYRAVLLANPDAIKLPLEQILRGCVYIAEEADSILGFTVVLPRSDGNATLDGLFIDPKSWRKGVGTKLVDAAAIRAADTGASSLCVVANPQAEAFYASCGFESVGEEQTRFGSAKVLVRRLLSR